MLADLLRVIRLFTPMIPTRPIFEWPTICPAAGQTSDMRQRSSPSWGLVTQVHVSRAMLSRYSHVRMDAKLRALTRLSHASVRRGETDRRPSSSSSADLHHLGF